ESLLPYSKSPKATTKAEAKAKEAIAKPPGRTTVSLESPSDALVHDEAIRTGLHPTAIYKVHKMTVPFLKDELIKRGFHIRTDTSRRELINMLLEVIATERRRSTSGSPMSVDS
ncbi:MAG: hypothetical protein ACKPKO_32485, partial [Candidatus Fonsibacter sp.]